MKTTLNTYQIADLLKQDESANWSYAGAKALAEWLEEIEEDTGEEMELDVVAIRCDFSEYEGLGAWAIDYFGGTDQAGEMFDGEPEQIRDHINDNGILIEFEGGIIVSSF